MAAPVATQRSKVLGVEGVSDVIDHSHKGDVHVDGGVVGASKAVWAAIAVAVVRSDRSVAHRNPARRSASSASTQSVALSKPGPSHTSRYVIACVAYWRA